LVKGTERAVAFQPELEILDIEIQPCKVGENSSDWKRLCEAVNKKLREKGSKVDRVFRPKLEILPVISHLMKEKGGTARAIVSGDEMLELKEQDDKPVLMAAFDIGTTTVAGYLLDGRTGEQLATASALNVQTEYGADVIMRANYSLEHGAEELFCVYQSAFEKTDPYTL
ncbi:MAG: ferredoxin, partial [Blautia massiliensis (ex Durand et al. 2017)]